MAFPVIKAKERILRTLGASEMPSASVLDIINECGEFLVTVHPWNWLTRQQVDVNLFKGIPYVTLPLRFPHELRDIIAVSPAEILHSVDWTSWGHLLDERDSSAPDTFNRHIALAHLPRPAPNLLFETEALVEAAAGGPTWFTVGAHVLAKGVAGHPPHPATGEVTTTRVEAAAAGNQVKQTVSAHRLTRSVVYRASILLKADGAALPTRSTLQLTSSAGALRTIIDITWATFTAALRTVAPVSAGAGVHTFGLERRSDGWVRAWVDVTYLQTADDGKLTMALEVIASDLGEATKALFVADPQLEAVLPAASSTVVPSDPTPYVPVPGAEIISGGEPVPVLEISPIPETDDLTGPISFVYRGGWPHVESERDVISIPAYLNSYFQELLVQWARGFEEEDLAYLTERIGALMGRGNVFLESAIERDADVQPEYGRIRNGAVGGSRYTHDWGSGTTVAGPEDS
jgi:hypothetical protein